MLESATRLLRSDNNLSYSSTPPVTKMPEVTLPVLAGSDTKVVSIEAPYQINVSKNVAGSKANPVAVRSDKVESLSGTIRYVEANFVTVSAKVGEEPIEFRISRELCDDELAKEGMPIKISIDDSGRYSTLRVERREKSRSLSTGLAKRLSAMEEWISSN